MAGDPHTRFQWNVIRELLADHKLSPVARLVGIWLVDRIRRTDDRETGERSGTVRISQQAIVNGLGIAMRSVQYGLTELKTSGHFEISETPWKGGRGRGHANIYKPSFRG
jgi:hypothetical protein